MSGFGESGMSGSSADYERAREAQREAQRRHAIILPVLADPANDSATVERISEALKEAGVIPGATRERKALFDAMRKAADER